MMHLRDLVTTDVERPEWAVGLGGAATVWRDLRNLVTILGEPWPGRIIVVNNVGVEWPGRIDAWVTLHPEKLSSSDPDHPDGLSWRQQRRANGYPAARETLANRNPELVDTVVQHWGGGSGGFYMLPVARYLETRKLVLCGTPINETSHFRQSTNHENGTTWKHADAHWPAWERKRRKDGEEWAYMSQHVRSMSGRTKQMLGAPTLEWLRS